MSLMINEECCTGCGLCVTACPEEALVAEGEAILDRSRCSDCLICVDYCPNDALKEGNHG